MPIESAFDLNKIYLIISGITLVVALISPIATAWLNNRHQLKLKKLELQYASESEKERHKQEIIEKYLIAAAKCATDHSYESLGDYSGYYALAFQHIPEALHQQMKMLHMDLCECDEASAMNNYEKLALMLQSSRKEKQK